MNVEFIQNNVIIFSLYENHERGFKYSAKAPLRNTVELLIGMSLQNSAHIAHSNIAPVFPPGVLKDVLWKVFLVSTERTF